MGPHITQSVCDHCPGRLGGLSSPITGIKDPEAMSNKLKALFDVKGYTARYLTFKELVTTTLECSASVTAYIDSIKRCGQKLNDMGSAVDSWILTSILLYNLREAYDSFVAITLRTVQDGEPDFDTLAGSLLDEERRRTGAESNIALVTRAKGKQPAASKEGVKNCSHCKKEGHELDSCWVLHPEKRPQRGSGPGKRRGKKGGHGGGGGQY